MRGVVAVAESGKVLLEQQRAKTHEAALIRRRHEQPPARLRDAHELPAERARILEVLNGFERDGDVRRFIGDRNPLTVQIAGKEERVRGEAGVTNGVHADVGIRQPAAASGVGRCRIQTSTDSDTRSRRRALHCAGVVEFSALTRLCRARESIPDPPAPLMPGRNAD